MSPFVSVLLPATALFCAFILCLAAKPDTVKRMTAIAFFITGIGGLLCYGYGYSYTVDNLPLAVVRTALSTATCFLGSSDFSAISEAPFFATDLGRVLFWLLLLVARFVTASAILITAGSGILRRLRQLLALRGELVLIYGTTAGALAFGRQMNRRSGTSVVFVDASPSASVNQTARTMGSLVRSDSSALNPDRRFLRSLGVRKNRRVRLYALSGNAAANDRYAAAFLVALKEADIPAAQTSLTLLGHEDSLQNAFLAGEDYGYGSVTVMDEAEMAARLLIRHVPPYQALSFDKTGLAQEDFHCLIIGFGRVGQAVLQQIAINGQFAGSTFHAAVFAPDCTNVSGFLAAQSAELMTQYDISFFDCDARSRKMYDYLNAHGAVNYVAVCTGNDKLNQEIADELLRYFARRSRHVPVSLCSHTGVQLLQQGTASQQWSLYSPDILCGDKLDRKARLLNHIYCGKQGSEEETWAACSYFNRMSSRAAADFSPAFLHIAGLTAEDVKRDGWAPQGELLTNLAHTEHLRWCAFHYAMGFSAMDRATHVRRAETHMEEVRSKGESSYHITKDMDKRLHACLVPWEQLPELDEAENAVTGGDVNYQKKDCDNVIALAELLRIEEETP